MKKIIIIITIVFFVFLIECNTIENEMIRKYRKLESMLIPINNLGNIDFDSMEIIDHQHIAYLLKAEARLGQNANIINMLTQYLIDHSDDNNDGEIGWGLGYSWKAFDNINPEGHVYAIETINVIDAYLEALNSKVLSSELSEKVKSQLHDVVILWNNKYWSESGNDNEKYFYWYSISKNDAIGCINIDAKMIGTQAKLLKQYENLFDKDEKKYIYNHIDKTYIKVMEKRYLLDGVYIWNYLEKNDSNVNDAIHHGFILEGISDYKKYRLGDEKWNDKNYTLYINQCVKDNMIYSTPQYTSNRCFNTGAIRWIENRDKQKDILFKSFDIYVNSNIEKRQLAFLLDAISIYLSK